MPRHARPVTRTVTVLAAAAAGCAALAACSSSPLAGKTPAQVLSAGIAGTKHAPAPAVSGTVTESSGTVSINLRYKPGTGCTGAISENSQGTIALTMIGSTVWMKPDSKFWASQGGMGSEVGQEMQGKYLKDTTSDPAMKDMTEVCSLPALVSKLKLPASPVEGKPVTINGQQAVPVHGTAKNSPVIYVSDTAAPRILRISRSAGSINITYASKPPALTAPPASESVTDPNAGSL